jgi:hypothetical protein
MKRKLRFLLNEFYRLIIFCFGGSNCVMRIDHIITSGELHFVAPGSSIGDYEDQDFYATVIGVNFVFLSHPNFHYYLIELSDRNCLKFIHEIITANLESKTFFVKGYNHPTNFYNLFKFLRCANDSKNKFIFLPDHWIQDYDSISSLRKDDYPLNSGSTLTYLPTFARYLNVNNIILSGFDFTTSYSFYREGYSNHTIEKDKTLTLLTKLSEHTKVQYQFHKKSRFFIK